MWRTLLPIHALFKLHRTFMLSQEYILAGLLSLIVGKPQWHLVMWYRLSNCIAVSLCVYTISFLYSFSSCKINLDTLHLDSFILPCCSFYSIHLVVHPLWNEQDQFWNRCYSIVTLLFLTFHHITWTKYTKRFHILL